MGKSVKDAMTSNPCTIDADQTVDQCGTTAQKKAAGRKGGRASARKS